VEKLSKNTPSSFIDLVSEVRGYLKSMLPPLKKVDSGYSIRMDVAQNAEGFLPEPGESASIHRFLIANTPGSEYDIFNSRPAVEGKTTRLIDFRLFVSDLDPDLITVTVQSFVAGTTYENDIQKDVSKQKAFAFVELEMDAFVESVQALASISEKPKLFSESQFGSYIDLSAPPNPQGDSTDPKNTNLTTLFDSVPFEPEMQPEIESQLGFPIIVPVTQGSLKFYTTSPSSPVQMFQIAFENDQYGVRRISQSGNTIQGFQTELYTKSKEGKNLLYLIVGFSNWTALSKLKDTLNTYSKKKISAKKFVELTPEKIVEINYSEAQAGSFNVNVGATAYTKVPKPEMDAAGALFTDGYRVLLARRATNKGSTKNFTTSRGGQWALPGGKMDPGETAEQSALRETEEELGTLPKFTPLDITITTQTQTPSRLINYNTVMFYVDPTDADNYKPMIQGEHSWETDGWAWVPLDEFTYQTDSQGRIQTIWSPELHPGLGKPIEFADGVQSILSLVKTEMPNWKKAKFTVESGEVKGLPFKGIKPSKKNPSGYTMSGVRKSPMGGEYIEYRPRMPDGSRPRIRLSTGSPIVASQQVSTELRQYSKAKKLGVKYSSKAKVSVSDSLSRLGTFTVGGKMIWPASAMPKFAEAANALFGGKATPKSMFENQLLQIAGLPITEVIPSAVEIVEKIIEKPAKTIEELKYLPAGKGKLTVKQKKVVKELKKSLTDILGTKLDRYDQIGALDSQYASELKEKINWALSKKKGPNYNDENVAKYLRYLVEARQAGLWKTYLDPGDMVLFRNLDSSLNNDTPSEIEQTRLQIKAMQDAGFWPKGNVEFKGTTRNLLCAQWLMIQDRGEAYDSKAGKTKKVNVGFVRYPQKKGYKKVPHDELEPVKNGVNPAKEQLVIDQYASTPKVTHNKQYTLPSWANKPFANVEGFWVGWNAPSYKKYTGLRAESWSSNIEAYASGSEMALMTRACWSDNFVLIPGKYPKGWDSPYVSEREVIAVYTDYEPIPVQVIRLKNSGAGSDFGVGDNFSLSKNMLQAYIAAHPPYQKGSKLDACPSQTKKKKNPSWSEADLIQFLSGGGDVTVRDLKYSFGGTSQSHTKRLQELVGRGILYYDNGKYGLTEDQSYRSNPDVGPENLVQVMDYDNGSTILVPALSVRYRSDVLLDEYGEPDKPSAKKVYAKDIPEFEMSHDTRGSALRAAQSYIDEYYVQDQYYY
jgi:8-oxo-dGTP pyrophosphatase MutT (NUDIX family)